MKPRERHLASCLVVLSLLSFLLPCSRTLPPASASEPDQPFLRCHPPKADRSPDGARFVSLSPSCAVLHVLEALDDRQTQRKVQLPSPASDLVFLDATHVVVALGSEGTLMVVDVEQGEVGEPFAVGEQPTSLCGRSDGTVVVADSKTEEVYLVDPRTATVHNTYRVGSPPFQLGWRSGESEVDVADELGRIVGTLALSSSPSGSGDP